MYGSDKYSYIPSAIDILILDLENGVWLDEMAYDPGKVGLVRAYIQIQNYRLHDVSYLPPHRC